MVRFPARIFILFPYPILLHPDILLRKSLLPLLRHDRRVSIPPDHLPLKTKY
jgi:hypothetical protein